MLILNKRKIIKSKYLNFIGISMNQLSIDMLDIQQKKYKLKKKQLKLMRKTLNTQQDILKELKEMKTSMQLQMIEDL